MATINTNFGRKTVVRRVGSAGEYYYTIPTPSAPNGEWWVLNPQLGFVDVAGNSRGLLAAIRKHRDGEG